MRAQTERTYYLLSSGYNLAQFFLAPIYPLFLISRGLDLFEINVVFAVYLLTTFAFEVPTGAVADRFGRRTSFLLACVVRAAAFLLYTRTTGLADCIVAEVIDGIGATLASGALEAWAVDGVRADGDHRPPDRMFARAQVIMQSSMILGGVPAGYLGERNMTWPWYVAAAIFALTGVAAALLMRDQPHHGLTHATRRPSFATMVTSAVRIVGASRPLQLLCGLTFAAAFASFPVYQYWQPRLQGLTGAGTSLTGWVLAGANLAGVLANMAAIRLVGRFGRTPVLVGAALWRGAAIAIAAAAGGAPVLIIGILLHGAGFVAEPLLAAWTNEHVDASSRATVLSIRSAFLTLGGALGLLSAGVVARAHGIPAAWIASAAVMFVAAPGYVALARVARVATPDLGIDVPAPSSKAGAPGTT